MDDAPSASLAPTTTSSTLASSSGTSSLLLSSVSSLVSDSLSATLTATATSAASASASALPGEGIELLPGNPIVNFILGLLVITASSILNSLGLNVMQYDHLRTVAQDPQPPEYMRPLWLAGLASYVSSQLFGSTLALRYLRAEYCAPLSSSSLVFNFIFARMLIGTPITKRDMQGTGLIILGVVLIVILGSINSGLSTSITLDRLYRLWARAAFLVYFVLQILVLFGSWLFMLHLGLLVENRQSNDDVVEGYLEKPPHRRFPRFSFTLALHRHYTALERQVSIRLALLTARVSDAQLKFYTGVGWAAVGGAMSGASLVFAKVVVMIGLGEGNIYFRPTPILTIILLAITAVLQMIALNRGLKAYSSTVVVPVFYAGYTLLGFANSMVFLDQIGAYSWIVLFLLACSIGVLLGGVVFLSSKKDTAAVDPSAPGSTSADSAEGASTGRRGTVGRARGLSASATTASAAEEGRALFDEDEERRLAVGPDVNADEAAKWEIGSDEDEEEEQGMSKPAHDGATHRRRSESGDSQRTNPWDDEDADEKDRIIR